MMKPALYYALRNDYSSYQIVAVTSEKSRQWFGRLTADNSATHGTFGSLVGRFDTEEAAREKIDAIKAINNKHEKSIKDAQHAYANAMRAERDAIADLLKQPRQPMIVI